MQKRFKGKSINSGIAIGHAVVFRSDEVSVEKNFIPVHEIRSEILRYEEIKDRVKNQIKALSSKLHGSVKKEADELLESHILLIDDEMINKTIIAHIEKYHYSAEYCIYHAYEKIIRKFSGMKDVYLSQRVLDIKDIRNRLLDTTNKDIISKINSQLYPGCLIICNDLLPTDLIALDLHKLAGIILEEGGESSHTAIIARNLNIPLIIQVKNIIDKCTEKDIVVLCTTGNEVIINPDNKELQHYQDIRSKFLESVRRLEKKQKDFIGTKDGTPVSIGLNMEFSGDTMGGLDGVTEIGLFRTEYLFIKEKMAWSENDQLREYTKLLKSAAGREVTIRTLDIGGDKPIYLQDNKVIEVNPALGFRAIRFSLADRPVFQTQIRAILLASVYGNVKILLPLISTADELHAALREIDLVKKKLHQEKKKFNDTVPVGIMVEVPAAVFILDELLAHADFISIGTNDLIQYTIAVDRNNPLVSHMYAPLHPAVLTLIRMSLEAAARNGKGASLCGELGGSPAYTPVLLGLGLRNFSMARSSIPRVVSILSKVSVAECETLAQQIITQAHYKNAKSILFNFIRSKDPDLLQSPGEF